MVSVSKPKLAPNFLGTFYLPLFLFLGSFSLIAIGFLGGNSVESAAPGRVKDFVAQNGGHTVITSILIANNGIAAVKEIRSIRKWYYSAPQLFKMF